jgi:hypothetical protein
MKRFAVLSLLLCAVVPVGRAQEVGAYVDYFHLSQTNTNFAGLGGRLGMGVFPHVKLEAEMNYDFNQTFNEDFSNGTTVTVQRSNMRLLHGLFGPTINLGHSHFHPFVTLKGGFLDTMLDSRPATLRTFFSSVDNLRAKNLMGALYPGGGVEGRLGPIGLRLDVGDEIYFNGGSHHNLRVAFGPYIHF